MDILDRDRDIIERSAKLLLEKATLDEALLRALVDRP
jgi:hypothetical protein